MYFNKIFCSSTLSTLVAALIMTAVVVTSSCGKDDGKETVEKTVILTPTSVTINDGNLSQTVSVGGTATGTITLNESALPAGVTATVSEATITVTGVRPTTDVPAITGSYIVGVTREGVTQNLAVAVNLTTTWTPAAKTVTLTPTSVTIDDENLTHTVSVGGTATGDATLDTSALPDRVTATIGYGSSIITLTGVRPTTEGAPAITGSFTVGVTREGVTENLTIEVNLTTTWKALTLPTTAGLYAGAPETLSEASIPIAAVAANNVAEAVAHINANAGAYTLLLDDDVEISSGYILNVSSVKLTIIGIGSERKISLTAASRIFRVGTTGAQTGIELILGANITLQGYSANTNVVVCVENGAALTMLDGSKITGNISNATYTATDAGYGAAVLVTGAGSTFTMKGGTITENSATSEGGTNVGGLCSNQGAIVILEGGSIEGNGGVIGDVFHNQTAGALTLSGNAKIGTLTLNAASATSRSALTIEPGWTGSVEKLNLRGNIAVASVIGYWANGSPILLGDGVDATTVTQITLGDFRSTAATTNIQAISPDYELNAGGVLVAKP